MGEQQLGALAVATGLLEGFTARESPGDIAAPREAAEKLGITEETARTVLKRVFSKTGLSRQSELVALLTKLVLR